MKIPLTKTKWEQGGVLVMSLLTCLVVGIVLASFLVLISSRHKLAVRSMGWNSAIPLLEAGIEEALTHLDKNKGSPGKDGWTKTTVGGQPVYSKQRNFPDGSYYKVAIYDATSKNPVIYSQGFILAPMDKYNYITRLVRVDVTNPPSLFVRGVTVQNNVSMAGNNTLVDGYDSGMGKYDALTNRNASGGIASMGSGAGAVDIGNGKVYGSVLTAPVGSVTMGPNASIGDTNWVSGGNKGPQVGSTNNNFNASFPTNAPPSGDPFPAPTVITGGGSNTVVLTGGTNQLSTFKSSGDKDKMIVTGKATLWVTGSVTISGGGEILIMPGASLTMYVLGSATLGGGGVVNLTGLPSEFSLIGMPTCKTVSFGGGSAMIGTINAPQADVVANGSPTVFGAIIGKSFTAVGGATIHYDTNLTSDAAPVIGTWKEL